MCKHLKNIRTHQEASLLNRVLMLMPWLARCYVLIYFEPARPKVTQPLRFFMSLERSLSKIFLRLWNLTCSSLSPPLLCVSMHQSSLGWGGGSQTSFTHILVTLHLLHYSSFGWSSLSASQSIYTRCIRLYVFLVWFLSLSSSKTWNGHHFILRNQCTIAYQRE